MIKIRINNKEYDVKEAKTEQERITGLQGVKELPENEGMLFYFDPEEETSMWMKGVEIPLDIIFINEDEEVTKVHKGIPNDETLISSPETAYVLEVNQNSNIKIGDKLEFDEDSGPIMKVLAPDGSVQMELWGGERIFRRAFTKQLVNLVKQANSLKNNPDKYDKICKRIGRKMFKEIKAQDERPAEYVNAPN